MQAIFDLADKLDHFKRPLESGLKVAKTGDKTFRWENGAEAGEAKFNYSLDENAKAAAGLVRAHLGERAGDDEPAPRDPL